MGDNYKRSKKGIYQILNIINQKCYIGSAIRFSSRFGVHRNTLRNNKHHSIILQRAWNKYGENSFIFNILEECDIEKLIEREQYYIDLLKPEYNICKIAGSCLGIKFSAESSLKKSLNSKRKGKFGKDAFDAIKIYQYNLDGTFIKEWDAIKDIERVLGFDSRNIGKFSKDDTKTGYRFIWTRDYRGEKIEPRIYRNRTSVQKKVASFNTDGILVQEFDSQTIASKALGDKSNGNINNALKNKTKKAHGYYWKYI